MSFNYLNYISDVKKFSAKIAGDDPAYYFVLGDADFLIEKALGTIAKTWKQKKTVEFQMLYADELTPDHLKNICVQRPFFSPPTLYLARRMEKWSKLAEFFKTTAPAEPQNSVIFCLDKTKKMAAPLLKALDKKKMACMIFLEPRPWEIEKSLPGLMKEFGITMTKSAQETIFEYCGGQLMALDNSFQTLKLAFPEKKNFTEAEIFMALGLTKNQNALALSDFLLDDQRRQAELLCLRLIENGESPLGILALLVRHCRLALAIASERDTGSKSPFAAAIPEFIRAKYTPYCLRIPKNNFAKALKLCHEVEIIFKSSSRSPIPLLAAILHVL